MTKNEPTVCLIAQQPYYSLDSGKISLKTTLIDCSGLLPFCAVFLFVCLSLFSFNFFWLVIIVHFTSLPRLINVRTLRCEQWSQKMVSMTCWQKSVNLHRQKNLKQSSKLKTRNRVCKQSTINVYRQPITHRSCTSLLLDQFPFKNKL